MHARCRTLARRPTPRGAAERGSATRLVGRPRAIRPRHCPGACLPVRARSPPPAAAGVIACLSLGFAPSPITCRRCRQQHTPFGFVRAGRRAARRCRRRQRACASRARPLHGWASHQSSITPPPRPSDVRGGGPARGCEASRTQQLARGQPSHAPPPPHPSCPRQLACLLVKHTSQTVAQTFRVVRRLRLSSAQASPVCCCCCCLDERLSNSPPASVSRDGPPAACLFVVCLPCVPPAQRRRVLASCATRPPPPLLGTPAAPRRHQPAGWLVWLAAAAGRRCARAARKMRCLECVGS